MDTVSKWLLKKFIEICERRGFEAKAIDGKIVDITPLQNVDTKHATSMELVSALSRPPVPKLIRNDHFHSTEEVTKRLLQALAPTKDTSELTEPVGFSPTSQAYVIERGITSLHDWRATLEFLSMADLWDSGEAQGSQLVLREPDSSVIDGFNIHITRDKRHNLGHKMLTHLARPMRIRTILTTNFDNLIEEAFRSVSKPLTVLPVSVKGGLPDPKTVHAQNSIIKLHGELLETRADYSLDSAPLPADKDRFAQYFLGPGNSSSRNRASSSKTVIPSHLIVMGYSGSDLRCIQMIKFLLDSNSSIRIFWICFNEWDVNHITRVFSEDSYRSRILIHQTNRPDLLLYELYQNLTLCLPGGGFAYEFSHKVPPRKYASENTLDQTIVKDLCNGIAADLDVLHLAKQWCESRENVELAAKRHLRHAVSNSLSEVLVASILSGEAKKLSKGLKHYARFGVYPRLTNGQKVANTFAIDLTSGASSALSITFRELSQHHNKHCIWLELQDFANVETLFQNILRVISLRIGRYQLEHLTLFPFGEIDSDDEELIQLIERHVDELFAYFNEIPNQWVLFLYGRNGPGACSGWENRIWDDQQYSKLEVLIEVLAKVGIKIVYAPLTETRITREQVKARLIEKTKHESVCDYFDLKIQPENGRVSRQRANFEVFYNKAVDINTDGESPYITDSKFPLGTGRELDDGEIEPKDFHDLGDKWDVDDKHDRTVIQKREISIFETLIDKLLDKWVYVPNYDKLGPNENKMIQDRFKFLFAITLFRQSRHTSAFFSDAVFSCPFRFNISGIDNDWTRAETVKTWIAELRDLNVFYYKPGGYCWKHRDIRLAIQLLLQKMPLFRCDNFENGPNNKQRFQHAFLLESRARAHYWIADWYFKAFATTGHSTPAIEALYHGFKCAEYSSLARPSTMDYDKDQVKIVSYRFLLFRSAIMNMTKTLRIGHQWLKFWLSSTFAYPMLDDSLTFSKKGHEEVTLKQKLESLVEEIGNFPDDAKLDPNLVEKRKEFANDQKVYALQLVDAFLDERSRLGRAVQGEGGHHPGKLRKLEILPTLNPKIVPKNRTNNLHQLEITFCPLKLGLSHKPNRKPKWKSDFVEWFSSRNFLDSKDLIKAIESIEQIDDSPIKLRKQLNSKLKDWRGNWCNSYAKEQDKTLMLVNLLGEFAYLHVKRAKLEFHASYDDSKTLVEMGRRKHNATRWLQATALCFSGVDLAKHLHASFAESEVFGKCKLHTLYGLSLANLDRFFEAHRHLNQAIALLSKSSKPMDQIELGIIRLRRAETYLTEAIRLKDIICFEKSEDSEYYQGALDRLAVLDTEIDALNKRQSHPNFQLDDETYQKTLVKLKDEHRSILECKPFANFKDDELNDIVEKYKRNEPRFSIDPPFAGLVLSAADESRVGQQLGEQICMHPLAENLYQRYLANNPIRTVERIHLVDMLDRCHTACLDDACNELEMARLLLSGKSQSSLWWNKIITLMLRSYGAQHRKTNYESLAFRRKIEHGAKAIELLQRGLLNCPDDPYVGLKVIDYFLGAWDVVSNDERSKGQVLTRSTHELVDSALKRYLHFLRKRDVITRLANSDMGDADDESLHLVHRYYIRVLKKFQRFKSE